MYEVAGKRSPKVLWHSHSWLCAEQGQGLYEEKENGPGLGFVRNLTKHVKEQP